jgi:hypothetical protein
MANDAAFYDNSFYLILQEVQKECVRQKVNGVFAMVNMSTSSGMRDIQWAPVLRISLIDLASDGQKYNLLAIALSKLSTVMTGREESGGPTAEYIGEVPYKGGRRSADRQFAYAFSGAEEDIDDEIIRFAEEFHKTLLSGQQPKRGMQGQL